MSTINISYSSELITNYLQAEIVAPYQKFEAIQTDKGHSLLFSIGTDKVLYLTEEVVGEGTGWRKNDISSNLAPLFPNAAAVGVKTFAVSQNPVSGGFCLLVALTVDAVDHLFIATSFTKNVDGEISINRSEIVYDNPLHATGSGSGHEVDVSTLNISGIYVMDTPADPLIVVDAEGTDGDIGRYYIDANRTLELGYQWVYYNLPVDMAPSTPSTPVTISAGRKAGDRWVNGLYTLGTIANKPSITYQPLFDGSDPSQPGLISNLMLPNNAIPATIASAPSVGTPATTTGADRATFTDLYVTTTTGDLYFFAADNQGNLDQGVLIMSNPLFAEMKQLFAYKTEDKVTIWGANRGQQVFYTQCAVDQNAFWGEWSYPLPIGEDVQQIAPYVNRVNGGNTYFAHVGQNTLKKAFQDPNSSIWKIQDITLPSTSDDDVQSFDSYTTKITLTDETKAPIPNAPMLLSSAYRIPVYINNHYYVLDTTPITIVSNTNGAVTIIQQVDEDMQGSILSVQGESNGSGIEGILLINPMDNATAKILTLQTNESLSSAEVKDDKGNVTDPLVPSTTTDDDLTATALYIQDLSTVNDTLTTTDPATMAKIERKLRLSRVSYKSEQPSMKIGEREVAAGDLFNFMKSTTESFLIRIEERAEGIWNFVCELTEEVLTFVIDTVEKVVGAIQAVFQAIGTVIKGLVQFVKFLFSWDDIKQTQLVLSNITKVLMDDSLAALKQGKFRHQLNNMVDNLQEALNNWADIPNDIPCPTIDEMSESSTNPSEESSATDDYLSYHFTNNSGNATTSNQDEDLRTVEELFTVLKEAIEAQTDIISEALQTFYSEILEGWQFRHLSLWEVLKKTLVIISDMILDSAQNILNSLFDFLLALADGIWDFLNKPVWIPILSHILEEFFDYELPSWLDVVMLVAAMPATMTYKVLKQAPPFPIGDPVTDQLVEATTMAEISDLIMSNQQPKMKGTSETEESATEEAGPTWVQESLFIVGRAITATNDALAAALVIPGNTPIIEEVDGVEISVWVNNLVKYVVDKAVGVWASPAPIQNEKMALTSSSLDHIYVAEKMIFTGILIGSKTNTAVYKKIDAVINFLLGGCYALVTTEHIYELIAEDQFQDTPLQASLAMTHCGVEFCTVGNTGLGGLMQFTPAGALKAGEAILSCLVSTISCTLRLGESAAGAVGAIVVD